jgi:hypothetical protein
LLSHSTWASYKQAYPERWENRTMALQTLPLFPGEKNPKPWQEAIHQVCQRLGLTEERYGWIPLFTASLLCVWTPNDDSR